MRERWGADQMTTGLQWRLYEKRGSRQRKHLLAQQSAPQYAVTWMSDVGALVVMEPKRPALTG